MKLLTPITLLLPAIVILSGNPVLPPQDSIILPSSSLSISTPTTPLPIYSLEEVAAHNSPDDCWLAISGYVYDLTTFTPINSADEKLFDNCGEDMSQFFDTNNLPLSKSLPRYLIGTLTSQPDAN